MKIDIPENILEQVEDVKGIGKGATKVQRANLAKDLAKELHDIGAMEDEDYKNFLVNVVSEMIGVHINQYVK